MRTSVVTIAAALCLGALNVCAQAAKPLFHRTPEGPTLDPAILQAPRQGQTESIRAWVLFTDKAITTRLEYEGALARTAADLSPRTLARRAARRSEFGICDHRDLPVNASYLRRVLDTGARLRVRSKWANAISVSATLEQLQRIATLEFVWRITPVRRSARISPFEEALPPTESQPASRDAAFYNRSYQQLQQINVPAVHDLGFTGQGIVIGILDTGFKRVHVAYNFPGHELQVLAEYDFVNNDGNTAFEPGDSRMQIQHGTLILGTLASYAPGELVGTAHDAAYVLAKTEDVSQEVPAEEDNYVAGLEWIEAHGADLATSSLGYIDWYNQADLDGQTAVTTIAVNTATANGLICVTAAGNSGHDANPATSRLIAPADALEVLTCGSVTSSGNISSFSSDGPTADGRVKPELLARGSNTQTISSAGSTEYTSASGTSLSTPLVAGAAALVVQAHPDWTVRQVRSALLRSADYYLANGQPDPAFVRGYGIIDTLAALQTVFTPGDINADGAVDLDDFSLFAACYTGAGSAGGPPTGCGSGDFSPSDLDGDGDVDLADFATFALNYNG